MPKEIDFEDSNGIGEKPTKIKWFLNSAKSYQTFDISVYFSNIAKIDKDLKHIWDNDLNSEQMAIKNNIEWSSAADAFEMPLLTVYKNQI